MIEVKNKFSQIVTLFIVAIVSTIFVAGCASNQSVQVQESKAPKLITDIVTSEDSDSTIVTVKGNRQLTYTAVKQEFPLGVLFHFPETALDNIQMVSYPPGNDTISSIRATEIDENGKVSRIFIALKRDVPYDLTPAETDLNISFPKVAAAETASAPVAAEDVAEETQPAPVVKNVPPATRLKSVSVTPLKSNLVVNVKADGTIKNYKSFAIDNPARIVFDIPGVKSPYDKEQRIGVKSEWATRVRHFGYADKVRLVIDTKKQYLSKYTAAPVDGGLLVYIGDVPNQTQIEEQKTTVAAAPKPAAAPEQKTPPAPPKAAAATKAPTLDSGKAAWVNRIDFSSEPEGKSVLIIGTTRPVEYEIKKVANKQLQLNLFNTNIPDYRKRALITTRFESAVDRVTPVQKPSMKNESLFTIEMRETVPYYVEQKDNLIRVNFSASAIPPKPYEEAAVPEWKKGMSDTGAESAKTPATMGKTSSAQPPAPEESLEERIMGADASRRYTGEKIALDFYDTDIKNVFRILKEISRKNFAIDKNVTGKVTLSLDQPVPWDQVLDLVLKMNQLGMTMEGDIIRIATLNTLAQENKLQQAQMKAAQQAQKQAQALEPLLTSYIPCNYSNAKAEVMPHVKNILSDRGKVSVDERNNQLIVTDTAETIAQAKQIVARIDKVTPQVIIEARVVEANTNFTREIGFNWGNVSLESFQIGNMFEVGPLNWTANNIPANFGNAGAFGFSFATLGGTAFSVIAASLQASEVEGKSNIISSPKIVTLDNKKAKIKQGFEVPYLERDSSGNATVRFKDVDLLLEVTPNVTPDNRIVMKIFVTKNDLVDPTQPEPALSTNEAETEILVDDGDTIVIGGILKSTQNWGETGIPGLRGLPAFGWLFKAQKTDDRKNELLIFITPRIVQLEQQKIL